MQEQNQPAGTDKQKPDTVAANSEQSAKQKTEPLGNPHGRLDKREGDLEHGELGGDLKKEDDSPINKPQQILFKTYKKNTL